MKTSDELAIEKTLAGEPKAFGEIVVRHQMAVFRLCHFVCGDIDTANNLVKRSFLAFANNMVSYRNSGDMHPFLIEHAVAELQSWIARGAQLVHAGGDDEEKLKKSFFFPAEEMPRLQNTSLEQIQSYSIRVVAAVRPLPPLQKLVVGLCFFEEMSYLKISSLVGLSVETVAEYIDDFRRAVLGE
ncbi:MAG: hypothetical protein Kow00107_11810 [Planctomycetota bacterium]